MLKKYALLGLIIAIAVSITAIGCGNGGTSEPTPTATATEQPGETGTLPDSYKFFMEWSDSDGNSAAMQYWVKGEKWNVAWNETQAGMDLEMMMLYDGESAYLYMPDANTVYKYATEWEVDNPGAAFAQEFEDGYWGDSSDSEILSGFQAACSGTASIEGQEDISGQSCTKFTCDFADGSVSSYWISDSGWLVKGEATSAEGYSYTMQYSNIDLNPTIDDSMFDIESLAPGVPITTVS